MANNEYLSVLAEGELDRVKEVLGYTKQLGDLIVEVNGKLKAVEFKVQGADKISAVSKGVQELSTNTQELTTVTNEYVSTANNVAKAQDNLTKETKLTAAQQRELASEYLILNKASREAQQRAISYSLALGKAHPITVQAVKDANALNDILKEAKFTVGDFTSNVGNYNGVGTQFNQLLRELPNAGISLQTFIVSLSNNFTYFVEAIAKARKEGDSWSKIIGTMANSAFGLIGIVNIAIAIFTAFGDKLFNSGKQAEQAKSAYDKLSESIKKYTDEVERNTKAGQAERNQGEDAAKRELEQLRARGATEAEIAAGEQKLAAIRKSNAQEQVDLYNKLSTAAVDFDKTLTDQTAKERFIADFGNELYDELLAASEKGVDLSKYVTQQWVEAGEKVKDTESERLVSQFNYEKRLREKNLKEYELYLKQRAALEEAIQKTINNNRQKEGIDDLNNAAGDITNQSGQRTIVQNIILKYKSQENKAELDKIDADLAQRLIGIEESYKRGLYTYDQYEAAKTKATNDNAAERFEVEKKGILNLLSFYEKESPEFVNLQKQLKQLELKSLQEGNNDKLRAEKAYADASYQASRQLSQRKRELVQQEINAAIEASNITADAELKKIDAQKSSDEQTYQLGLDRINATIKNEEEKTRAVADLQNTYLKQQSDNQKREEQIERRRFIIEKAAALAQLAITTNLTVAQITAAAALANTKLPGSGVALLAQIPYVYASAGIAAATIGAQVLAYAKGTENHPGGVFIAGEAGERELVQRPDGTAYWTDNKASYYNEPKGTRVIPEHKLISNMAQQYNGIKNIPAHTEIDTMPIAKEVRKLNNNRPVIHIHNYSNDVQTKLRAR